MIVGTMDFALPASPHSSGKARVQDSTDATRAGRNTGENNGQAVTFVITIDPTKLYTLGESTFTSYAVAQGICDGIFPEGTEWMTPTGRARIISGKLRYTGSRKLYKLPKVYPSLGEQ